MTEVPSAKAVEAQIVEGQAVEIQIVEGQAVDLQGSLKLGVLPTGQGFVGILKRDLLLAFRHRGELANPLIFFIMVTALIPLAVGPQQKLLSQLAPGMIWVMALLGTLLSSDSLFQSDYADGTLEQLIISPQPLWLLVLAKILAHWLVTGLPITLAAPMLGVMLGLPEAGYGVLVLGLAMGTAAFSLFGAIGAALTVALHKGGVLLSLIVMPLYFPILIFGSSAVQRMVDGGSAGVPLALLGAVFAFALLLSPFATSASLRAGING